MKLVYLTTQSGSKYVFDMDEREIMRVSNKVNPDGNINNLNGEWVKVIGVFMPVVGKPLIVTLDVNGKRPLLTTSPITEIVRK